MKGFPKPQLALLVEETPVGDEWLHEIKLDGYRTLTRISKGKVTCYTRNGLDWTEKYQALLGPLSKLPVTSAWLDGEICVTDKEGRTSFHELQAAVSEGASKQLDYYLFDLLELNGVDLRGQTLEKRKAALKKILKKNKHLIYCEDVDDGPGLFKEACKFGLEGIISKKRDAPYVGARKDTWVKSKCHLEQEFVIIGYAVSEKRLGFKSLLMGVFEGKGKKKVLRYVGRVGTGFDQKDLSALKKKFKPFLQAKSPLAQEISLGNKWRKADEVQWLKPQLLAQIEFRGWTADQQLRQAAFKGLREDKKATTVIRETPKKKDPP